MIVMQKIQYATKLPPITNTARRSLLFIIQFSFLQEYLFKMYQKCTVVIFDLTHMSLQVALGYGSVDKYFIKKSVTE